MVSLTAGADCTYDMDSLEVFIPCVGVEEPGTNSWRVTLSGDRAFLYIVVPKTGVTCELMDVSGHLILNSELGDLTTVVPVRDLPKGLYFVRLRDANFKASFKVVIP